MTHEEREALREPSKVAKSLKWILAMIEDCGPNTFKHAIHGYVGEAIQWLAEIEALTARAEAAEARVEVLEVKRNAAVADVCLACECLTMASGHGLYDGCDCCKWRGQKGGERDG